MKISELKLRQEVNNWEIRRVNRLKEEEKFINYSGLVHGIELHIPFTCWTYAFDMIKEAKRYKGRKILVSGGDSVNIDMLSFFYKRGGARMSPIEELSQLVEFLKYAETVYDKIIFLESNHELRLKKFIERSLSDRTQALQVLKLMKTLKDIFDSEGLSKIVYPNDYLFQIGDSIYCHFENNSMVAGKVARDLIQYLIPRIEKEWNMVFQFHTHSQSKIPLDRKIVVEPGACVESMDYWRSGKLSGKGKMISIGYSSSEMKKGKVDINKSTFITKGWEGYL